MTDRGDRRTPLEQGFTPDVLERIFHAAVAQGDAKGVESALMLMAPQDPRRAQELLDTLEVALHLTDKVAPMLAGVDG